METKEEKKDAFMKKATDNKANFDLHRELIAKHIGGWELDVMRNASVESYFKKGKVSGGLLLGLIEYAEEYANSRNLILKETLKQIDSSRNYEEALSKIEQEAALKLEAEKERLIKLRVEERAKTEIDFMEESLRRFPRIARTFQSTDQSEHWYWNDGSKEGLRLISFYQVIDTNFMNKENDYKINCGFKYR